ncbi:MAG: hypothetical protein WC989_08790 [Micavibrio sp.]
MSYKPAQSAIGKLMDFAAAEREDDPARLPDILGPYEILHQRLYGALPADTWNLRVEESRSGLLWQALSGLMDEFPSYAGAYMGLALDTSLSAEEYRRELMGLNKSWDDFIKRKDLDTEHRHGVMSGHFHRVSCVQCSMLTALACQDPEMHDLFVKELLPLKTPQERIACLKEKGLLPFLDMMPPQKQPGLEPALTIRNKL